MMPGRAPIDDVNDYDGVADIYDAYARADFDLAFYAEETSRGSGPILELMAGTGRVTRALVASGRPVVSVDRSLPMLYRLRTQVHQGTSPPMPICADVRGLPLKSVFELVVIPFNSFAEIVSPAARRRALEDIARVLAPNGRCIVTLHNPIRRSAAAAGGPRTLGPVELPDGSQMHITITERLDDDSRTVTATQHFETVRARDQRQWKRTQILRFALIEREEIDQVARREGFTITDLYGDYDRCPFDARTSPYLIWMLTKPAGT